MTRKQVLDKLKSCNQLLGWVTVSEDSGWYFPMVKSQATFYLKQGSMDDVLKAWVDDANNLILN